MCLFSARRGCSSHFCWPLCTQRAKTHHGRSNPATGWSSRLKSVSEEQEFVISFHHAALSSSGDSLGDQITSLGPEKEAQDGNSVTLSCNYSGTVYNLLWYRQYQRSKPELLLSMTESGDPVKADPSAHWFSAKVDKHRKLMELEISPAKVTDSAQYYCALVPTVTGNLFPQYIIFLHISLAFH